MTTHRIDLRPDLRSKTGWNRDDRPVPCGFGGDPMVYRGEVIGASERPVYDAARYLLKHDMAWPDDTVCTYRGETLCQSGIVGKLSKWTVRENKHGNSGLELRRYVAFPAPGMAAGSQNACRRYHHGCSGHWKSRWRPRAASAMMSQSDSRLAHGVMEVARHVGISRSTVFKLIADGKIRSIKIGGRRMIPDEALRDLIRKGA